MWMALALASATTIAPPGPACAVQPLPAAALRVLNVVRVVKGADGKSHFSLQQKAADAKDYLDTGKTFYQTDLGAADRVRLVIGPPEVIFPMHVSPGLEMFLTIAGETFVTLPDGTEAAATPGRLIVMDDAGSTSGHGGGRECAAMSRFRSSRARTSRQAKAGDKMTKTFATRLAIFAAAMIPATSAVAAPAVGRTGAVAAGQCDRAISLLASTGMRWGTEP